MGNDIRENKFVKEAIISARGFERNQETVDTDTEVSIYQAIIKARYKNKDLSKKEYKEAIRLFEETPVEKTDTYFTALAFHYLDKDTKKAVEDKYLQIDLLDAKKNFIAGKEVKIDLDSTIRKANNSYEGFVKDFNDAIKAGNYDLVEIVSGFEKNIDKMTNKTEKNLAKVALRYFIKNDIKKTAQAYVKEAIENVPKTEKDKEYAIQDKAIDYLKQNGKLNKYTEKEISRANLLKDSYGEALIEKQQLINRVENKKVQSDADIKEMLNDGKNDYHLIAGLEKAGLVSAVDKDGNRDLSVLSQVIRDFLGSDLTRSHAAKEVKKSAEIENLKKRIETLTGEKYSNREIVALIKLCGYRNDKFASLGKIAKNTLIGTAIGAAGGALDNLFSGKTRIKEGDVNVTNTVELNIKGSGIEDIDLGKFNGSVQIDKTTGIVKILIEEFIKVPGGVVELGHSIGSAALRGALVGGCLGALGSLAPDKETQVVCEPHAGETKKEYLDDIDEDDPYKPWVTRLANLIYDESIKDDTAREEKWNKDFNALMDFLGGNSGIVNKYELLNVSEKDLTAFIETLGIGKTETPTPEEPKVQKETITTVANKEDVVKSIQHTWTPQHSWQAIVATYYPEAYEAHKDNLKPVIDAFRKAQGISFKSGIPVGQTSHLDKITVNGVTYEPKADANGDRLAKYTSDDHYGWGSKFFSKNWNIPTKGVSKVTSKEVKTSVVKDYTATRESDKVTNTNVNQAEAQKGLLPKPAKGVETTVTIVNADGTKRTEVIKEEEK